MTWDEWRGSLDGRPTFWLKRLLHFRGYRMDLHKFVGADDQGCFHSHPSYAVRIVLWGGYEEQVIEEGRGTYWADWRPGSIGIIAPAFAHRVSKLLNGRVSYSLWFRGPIIAQIKLLGWGWPVPEGSVSPQGGKS